MRGGGAGACLILDEATAAGRFAAIRDGHPWRGAMVLTNAERPPALPAPMIWVDERRIPEDVFAALRSWRDAIN